MTNYAGTHAHTLVAGQMERFLNALDYLMDPEWVIKGHFLG